MVLLIQRSKGRHNVDQLILHHHLGLGDHFICNGLVHALRHQLRVKTLILPVKEHNLPTVRALYEGQEGIELMMFPVQPTPTKTATSSINQHEEQYRCSRSRSPGKNQSPLIAASTIKSA